MGYISLEETFLQLVATLKHSLNLQKTTQVSKYPFLSIQSVRPPVSLSQAGQNTLFRATSRFASQPCVVWFESANLHLIDGDVVEREVNAMLHTRIDGGSLDEDEKTSFADLDTQSR